MRCRPPPRSPAAPASAASGRRASRGPRSSRSARNLSAAASYARGTCKDGLTLAGTSRHVWYRSCRAVTAHPGTPARSVVHDVVATVHDVSSGQSGGHPCRSRSRSERRAPRNRSASRGAVPGSAFRASGTVTGPGSPGHAGESPGSGEDRSPARSADCKGDLIVNRRRGIQVRRVSKGMECDCHG